MTYGALDVGLRVGKGVGGDLEGVLKRWWG